LLKNLREKCKGTEPIETLKYACYQESVIEQWGLFFKHLDFSNKKIVDD